MVEWAVSGQDVHVSELWPVLPLYLPAVQDPQSASASWPALDLNLPAGQFLQPMLPPTFWYWPAGQVLQDVWEPTS